MAPVCFPTKSYSKPSTGSPRWCRLHWWWAWKYSLRRGGSMKRLRADTEEGAAPRHRISGSENKELSLGTARASPSQVSHLPVQLAARVSGWLESHGVVVVEVLRTARTCVIGNAGISTGSFIYTEYTHRVNKIALLARSRSRCHQLEFSKNFTVQGIASVQNQGGEGND